MTILLLLGFLVIASPTVSAADASIEAYLGDTLNLHGVSYTGTQVYLFLTGPNLPENGVTLTDVNQRADQGHFTVVDLDADQQWSLKWNTARIESSIDPGTYIVYVTNEPVDRSNLGGTNSYKTLEVFLRDPGTSRVSVQAGTVYTLNPEKHTPAETAAPTLVIASPTVTATTPALARTSVIDLTSGQTLLPVPSTTRALLPPGLAIISGIVALGIFHMRRS